MFFNIHSVSIIQVLLFFSFICSNNMNFNYSVSGGKFWQLFILDIDVFVVRIMM